MLRDRLAFQQSRAIARTFANVPSIPIRLFHDTGFLHKDGVGTPQASRRPLVSTERRAEDPNRPTHPHARTKGPRPIVFRPPHISHGATTAEPQNKPNEAIKLHRKSVVEYQTWRLGMLEQSLLSARSERDYNGVLRVLESLRSQNDEYLLTVRNAEFLRERLVKSALGDNKSLRELVEVAEKLSLSHGFQWPELYIKIVHFFFARTRYDDAFLWHLRLFPNFPPQTEIFAALISTFAVFPEPQMQRALERVYIFSSERQLYDHLIPAIYEAGNSLDARSWRKKLLALKDFPFTERARPFLNYLARWHPNMPFAKEELDVIRRGAHFSSAKDIRRIGDTDVEQPARRELSDYFVAKLFASSWTSVEFVLHLVQGLGLRILGTRSLQALALREPDSDAVARRIKQLGNMGVQLSDQVYCTALADFARKCQDDLLQSLLHCDIHPDEFDDPETLRLLMSSAKEKGDAKMEKLLAGVESLRATTSIAQHAVPSFRASNQWLDMSDAKNFGNPQEFLDQLEKAQIAIPQSIATGLINRVFTGIGFHPFDRNRVVKLSSQTVHERLNKAIHLLRRIAAHDVAIRVRVWQLLLYNLGRLGRFDELEQLCLEIVELYDPSYGGLIPIHTDDIPPMPASAEPSSDSTNNNLNDSSAELARKMASVTLRYMESTCSNDAASWHAQDRPSTQRNKTPTDGLESERDYIPSDLTFSHRHHPMQQIFDIPLQRSICRWGFDHKLKTSPHRDKASVIEVSKANSSQFDIACGVRLLAKLRDRGVYIDKQIPRATIMARLVLATVPGRSKHRARDSHELLPERVKKLVDVAWGSELLPPESQLMEKLEEGRQKQRFRYPKLYARAYDKSPVDNAGLSHGTAS